MDSHFTWVNLISFVDHNLYHIIYTFLSGLLLLILGIFARRSLKISESLVPDKKINIKSFFEVFIEQIMKLSDSVVGVRARFMVPFFCYLFIFILAQNLLSLIPGFLPPTQNANTTLALGLFAFISYNYYGFKEHGAAYLKQFLGPLLFMAPLFVFIEILCHLFRPLSLGLRLFGNMKGDHAVMGIFLDLSPWVVPVIFYFLGFFVCILQSFVFTILTMVYVSLAISHDH